VWSEVIKSTPALESMRELSSSPPFSIIWENRAKSAAVECKPPSGPGYFAPSRRTGMPAGSNLPSTLVCTAAKRPYRVGGEEALLHSQWFEDSLGQVVLRGFA